MALGTRHCFDRAPRVARGRATRAIALAVLVLLAPVGALDHAPGPAEPPLTVADQNVPQSDVPVTGTIERLHADGVTGENVSVGVLDVTGYETDSPSLAGQVAATRSFGPRNDVPMLGRNAHGTATASIVANVAPDAELYLASFTTPDGYREATSWLLANDVDVLVVPVSFYGQPRTTDATIADPVKRAARRGVTVVTAAGNLADSHWRGEYRPDERGRLRFDGSTRNHLRGNEPRVVLWLSWAEPPDADFTIELYREGETTPIARSENYTMDAARNERLVATVDPDADHYVVVRGPLSETRHRLTLESPTHEFEFADRHGSVIQPAVPDDVVTVGAYDVAAGDTATYSAAGPVVRTPGVDVLGPTNLVAPGYPRGFEGTSAAAAYVGGLAVLVHDVDPDTTPGHVESLLERTARDVGRTGPDTVAGYGVVQPESLIHLARNESTPRRSADGVPDTG